MMETSCLYHSDKYHFDVVCREIEKAKIIPRAYARRLAMCVCSCRKSRFNLAAEVKQLDLQNMACHLENCVKTNKWPLSLVTLLKPLVNTYYVRIENYSQSMLIWVLFRAVNDNNFDLLETLVKKPSPTGPTKEQQKITPTQFQFMLNKKWKNSKNHCDIIIPLFAGNTKLLQGDERFKCLQLQHKDIVIKIDHKANTQFMEKNIAKTRMKLAGKCESEMHKFGQALVKLAADIQMTLDRKHRIQYEKRKEQRAQKMYSYCSSTNDHVPVEYKEEMEDHYTRRCNANRKGSKTKSVADSCLKDGHCMNCLDKFVTLKNPEDCKYHPGFIGLDSKWSCCGICAETDQPTLQEHKNTGCFTGVHNWRHGKDLKKTKKHRNFTKDSKVTKLKESQYEDYQDDKVEENFYSTMYKKHWYWYWYLKTRSMYEYRYTSDYD